MKIAITALVQAQVEKTFPPADRAWICAELAAADLPLINHDGERVHLAIVHLSGGSLDDFRRHVAQARIDWRDVLVTDGLAHLGWPLVLQARGIDPAQLSTVAASSPNAPPAKPA